MSLCQFADVEQIDHCGAMLANDFDWVSESTVSCQRHATQPNSNCKTNLDQQWTYWQHSIQAMYECMNDRFIIYIHV